jgi:hypothetical protein
MHQELFFNPRVPRPSVATTSAFCHGLIRVHPRKSVAKRVSIA